MTEQKIIQGDCLEVMRGFADKSFDLVLTSPPYDNLRDYKGYSFDFEGTAKEIARLLKDGGVCVWVVGDAVKDGSESGTSFRQALFFMEIGMRLHDTMIYQKRSKPLTHNRYEQHFEYMFVLSNGTPKTFNGIKDVPNKHAGQTISSTTREVDGKTYKSSGAKSKKTIAEYGLRGNVWYYEVGKNKSSTDNIWEHPATFPEKLAYDHIMSWSNEKDAVLDPFLGSGTTLKMAKLAGRNCVGIEISPEYCKIAQQRLDSTPTPMF